MLCAIITTAKEAFCLMTKNAISMMNSILSPQLNDFVLYLMYFIIKQIMSSAYSKSMRLFLASSTASLSIFHVPANCIYNYAWGSGRIWYRDRLNFYFLFILYHRRELTHRTRFFQINFAPIYVY